jgi:hypothetical protein
MQTLKLLLAAGGLWAGAVNSGAGEPQAMLSIQAVPMVDGCPDLGGWGLDYGDYVVRNPEVRRNLERLRCGLTLEGYPPGLVDLVVSGGESFVGHDGRVYSVTHGVRIPQRRSNSAHNVELGARAVDLLRTGQLKDRQFYTVMNKYTAFRSPHGHGRRHRHLSLGRDYDCPKEVCAPLKRSS